MLMILSKSSNNPRLSKIPPGRVTTRTMPKMIPKIPAISAVQKVMYNVWIVASTNSSEIATTLGKYRSKKVLI